MKARITLGIAGALIALTMSFMAFGGTPGAVAVDGDLLKVGDTALSDTNTVVCLAATDVCGDLNGVAFLGETHRADGIGVLGEGETGIEGYAHVSGGTGVYGVNDNLHGIGVHGASDGTGSAVYGEMTGTGVGVFGDTTDGTGVIARSTNGNALDVRGKATFSRSGVVTVAEGTSSKTVTLAGVSTSSLVLATAQQAKAAHVKAAVPGTGLFTIRLTAKAQVGGLKVAYFVLN